MATGDLISYIGGIVGYFQNFAIAGCVNIGKVKGKYAIGGIVGGCNAADAIEPCVNAGWVNGSTAIGGIIGRVDGLDRMYCCLNTGVVQGESYVYSLIGYNFDDSLENNVYNCYYDNQMSPYAAIYGIANPPTVEGLSTEKLTKPEIKDALVPRWTICPNGQPVPPNQVYSYPILHRPPGNDYGAKVAALAALPVRLASGTLWNNVSSVVNLDMYYGTPAQSINMVGGSLSWEAKQDGRIVMPIQQGVITSPNGSHYKPFHNPTPAWSGTVELTAYVESNGNIYKKTVPIITNGIPFKINISDYEMYGFEASEVSPNIVTSNAVMDVSSAVEGYLTVAIFDMSGAKVMEVVDKSVTAQSQTQVELNNLNNLSAGNYMVAVSLGNNVVFRRFVKE